LSKLYTSQICSPPVVVDCYYSFIRNIGSDIYNLIAAEIPKNNNIMLIYATYSIYEKVAVDLMGEILPLIGI